MTLKRIRMTHAYGETPPNVFTDFDWIRRNEKALLEKYGECSIIVYKEQVLGTGPTYEAALENAHELERYYRELAGDLAGLLRTQARILDACWSLLAPGGRLVYATCSVLVAVVTRPRCCVGATTTCGPAAPPPF